jgi:cytochrome P450
VWAGLDPDGFFRRRAGRSEPLTVVLPGLGPVLFFARAESARDILTAAATTMEAPTPNPIEPIIGKDSVILVSGEDHRRKRRMLLTALHGQRVRDLTDVMTQAARDESAHLRPGGRVALSATARSIALRVVILAMFGVENADCYDEFANVATGLMHSNTAALMLLPWLRKGFGGIGPWARLIRLRARFDELLAAQVDARRSDTSDRTVFGALLAGSHATALDPEDLHQQLRTLWSPDTTPPRERSRGRCSTSIASLESVSASWRNSTARRAQRLFPSCPTSRRWCPRPCACTRPSRSSCVD